MPQITSQKGNVLTLFCADIGGDAFQIEITLGLDGKISSECTCKMGKAEVCEHQVAALQKIIDSIKKRTLSNDFYEYLPNSRDTIIPTVNGRINFAEVNKIEFSKKSYYYSPCELLSITRKSAHYSFYDLGHYFNVSLEYNDQADQLLAKCSCKSINPCYHKAMVLDFFTEKFGSMYFQADFLDIVKQDFMKDKNFPEHIHFDELFILIVAVDGIRYEEKFSNVIHADHSPLAALGLDKLDAIALPQTSEYAVAFCLEFYRKEINALYPFIGKQNKEGAVHTKFKRIFPEDVFEQKPFLKNPQDFDFLTAALGIHANFRYPSLKKWEKKQYDQLFKGFLPFLQYIKQGFPIYSYDSRNSFVKKNLVELHLLQENIRPIVRITESGNFLNIQMKVRIDGQLYGIQSSKIQITPVGLIFNEYFIPYQNADTAFTFAQAAKYQELNVIKTSQVELRKKIIDPLSKFFEVEFSGMKASKKPTKTLDFEKHIYLSDEQSEYIVLRPLVKYGEQLLTPLSEEKLWVDDSGYDYQERQKEEEETFMHFVKKLHPDFEGMENYFYLPADRALERLWLMDAIDQMGKENIKVFGLNTLRKIPYNLNKPSFTILLSSNTDWFDMKMDVSFGDQKADLRDIQKALVKRQNYVELKDGTLGLLPQEWIEKYKKYFKVGQVKKDQLEISNYQFSVIDELFEEMSHAPQFLQDLYEKKKRLANLKALKDIPKPKNLKADLRPYQQEGLNWMVFLDENQLGGCLADDMGLGKTLQTIAFLQHLKNNNPGAQRTSLVVAPTSLMFNWKAELKKFAPKLSVLTYVGPNRAELNDEIEKHDVVLTTYGSLINDITEHQKREYHYAILDESQAIKNPESQRYKAVRLLKSKNRLVLTGTPIENNTFDLYSQFNFLNPGFFGSVKHFRSTFSDAIDKEQDQETSLLLAKMINPFLLRRTKSQVATELPPKTEAVVYCEMGAEQRKVYDYYKQYFREQIQKQIENEGINKSQMYILQGLTKLRQICNSTELADSEKDFGAYSAKLDELVRHLKEKVSKHKVLIFSQFVGMLQIIQRRLEIEGISFEYLDGQTRKREEKVNNFQSDDSIRVFLISLKAGGTGLNLTEADYVYLVDPWWNPAVENQAIDRCYRIGQNKSVMAYRMICTDTIEEKIVQLQERKKSVASEVIRIDMDKKSFNMKEVEHLFA
jgi:SNF2 family DNA or RNA helicase